MCRNSFVARFGAVYVDVLESISTEGWMVEDLDKHVSEVREWFDDVPRVGLVKAWVQCLHDPKHPVCFSFSIDSCCGA
ncbi:hypothetical protein M2284_003565 [Rhodococcus sp. LBL1]|nr:hypothetical protein [Rhodococcus sp. LBL1]MDH6685516.1 hypothetical protein [Rhodococcus sp. LBL2]